MKVLILGSGGREHALAWKINQSSLCSKLFVAPGNAGTSQEAENVPIDVADFDAIANFIADNQIQLLVVGPEVPLVEGIHEHLTQDSRLKNLLIVGPSQQGAMLEGSKDYAKDFMARHGIPTADYKSFTKETIVEAREFIRQMQVPIVLKADGLAAGKGVLICEDHTTALKSIDEMLVQEQFGQASNTVVIEQFLKGIELSVFVLTDGEHYVILPEAKDYKRIGEKDSGPNTGGMGAVSPVNFAQGDFLKRVEEEVVKPTIAGLKADKIDYKGFIFIGLMNTDGQPWVIEYNVRMGDPETQVVMPRLKSDLMELLIAAASGTLDKVHIETHSQTASTVVMVAGGYPDKYGKGDQISGLNTKTESAIVFHAGTKKSANDEVVTAGGRVLNVTGIGDNLEEALQNAYKKVQEISWENAYFRRDIGQDLLALE